MSDAQDRTTPPLSVADVLDAIQPIIDPDMGISIVDLGLIRTVTFRENPREVDIEMTLTSPGCPIGPQLMAAVRAAAERLPAIDEANVHLLWSPPWNPRDDASEEGRWHLGIYD